MLDIRQSSEYANYLSQIGWTAERISGINYFIKKLPLIGSILKIQRPEKIDFGMIEKLAVRYRAFHIVIEPNLTTGGGAGFKLSKSPYLPTKTLWLDLTKPLKFNKETRRGIRMGEKLIVKEYSSPQEIEIFRRAWKKSVKFTRFVPSTQSLINLRKSFPKNKSLFLASHNLQNKIIGGAVFTRTSHAAYYWYAFTSQEGRSSLAQYALVHQGLLWSKKRGCKIFDFEGIYDPRFPNRSWLGFTHFKKSFGGKEIYYPGCYTKTNLFRLIRN